NHIHYLLDDQNQKIDNISDIKSHCVDYYSELLGGGCSHLHQVSLPLLRSLLCKMPSPRSGLRGTIGFIMPAMMILLLYSKDWTGPYGILYWRVYPIDGVDVFLLNGLGSPSICKLGYQQIHSSN
ncbi:hypothetical protein HID58_018431, partial [Brassica napus]